MSASQKWESIKYALNTAGLLVCWCILYINTVLLVALIITLFIIVIIIPIFNITSWQKIGEVLPSVTHLLYCSYRVSVSRTISVETKSITFCPFPINSSREVVHSEWETYGKCQLDLQPFIQAILFTLHFYCPLYHTNYINNLLLYWHPYCFQH